MSAFNVSRSACGYFDMEDGLNPRLNPNFLSRPLQETIGLPQGKLVVETLCWPVLGCCGLRRFLFDRPQSLRR
jgi:hypothetical protein